MFSIRGYTFTHEGVRDWETRFAPLLSVHLKAKSRGQAGKSWYVDETYIKVNGQWHYLYRTIDRDRNLVDTMLSVTRDLAAAKVFFKKVTASVGHKPQRVTTDKQGAYPRCNRQALGRNVRHHTSEHLNNYIEQHHRVIKDRYYPMRGFGSFVSAARFCTAFDELRHYFRSRSTCQRPLPLSEQCRHFGQRFEHLLTRDTFA